MLTGLHAIIYAHDAEKARAFFRDTLGLSCVDAGHGWLIFAMPPAELAFHPAGESDDTSDSREDNRASNDPPTIPAPHHQLFLMCDDIRATVAALKKKGARFTADIADLGWGLLATFQVPGAGDLSIYEPRHPTAIAPPA
jgi:catechol 2,3-dioxygenase-like lactoylglutathione lyase family enzyme